ncbi:hypothetical protein [Streptomyces sp. N35]|uniref:hypothetical protein n=1 Tax=Streptomyces sp. N35 TaxID=2795730 RepID=UPI0018F6E075|nr:hypothetical protein [Streptomyces sp. N35]
MLNLVQLALLCLPLALLIVAVWAMVRAHHTPQGDTAATAVADAILLALWSAALAMCALAFAYFYF